MIYIEHIIKQQGRYIQSCVLVLLATISSQLRSFRLQTMTGSTGICLRLNESYAIVMMSPFLMENGSSCFGILKTSPCGL